MKFGRSTRRQCHTVESDTGMDFNYRPGKRDAAKQYNIRVYLLSTTSLLRQFTGIQDFPESVLVPGNISNYKKLFIRLVPDIAVQRDYFNNHLMLENAALTS